MNELPLQAFRLLNFKAVRDSGMVDFSPLTVFIGNNGSGKSSLIEGLETFRDVVVDGLDHALRRWRGFEHICNHFKLQTLLEENDPETVFNPIAFELRIQQDHYPVHIRQQISLDSSGNKLFISAEEANWSRSFPIRRVLRSPTGHSVYYLNKSKTKQESDSKLNDGESVIERFLGSEFERWQFLNLSPDAMGYPCLQDRAAGRIRLARNGANVAGYLNEIRELDLDIFNGILDALRYVMPYASDLQPALTSELERAFYLKLKEESFEVPGWLLSTGTLRILALLACLRHPNPPSLLVVEEVENGLDPRTLHLLVEEIRGAISSGRVQVVLTTHSPYLLDLLDLSHIIVVERENGQPVFRRPDAKQLKEWSKSFSPGKLYTMGRLTNGD